MLTKAAAASGVGAPLAIREFEELNECFDEVLAGLVAARLVFDLNAA